MKRISASILAAALIAALFAAGCASKSVSVSNVKGFYVESFAVSGQTFLQGAQSAKIGDNSTLYDEESFPDNKIVRVELDAAFINLESSAKIGSDDYRKDVYAAIKSSVTFTAAGEKIDPVWGFWPKTAEKDRAEQTALLYLVPKDSSLSDLKLIVDGAALGDDTFHYEFTDFTEN